MTDKVSATTKGSFDYTPVENNRPVQTLACPHCHKPIEVVENFKYLSGKKEQSD